MVSTTPNPPRRLDRAATDLVLAGAALSLCAAAAIGPERADDGPILCPFRLATGSPCPACGTTRVWTLASRGRLDEAALLNPFALAVLAVLVGAGLWRAASLVSSNLRPPNLVAIAVSPLTFAFLAVWLAWWIGT